MPDPWLRILHLVADEPYGWAASYRASVMPGQVVLTLRLQLQPGEGVTSACLDQVRRETAKAVARYYDGRFTLDGHGGRRPVRVNVEFVTSDPDLEVTVHAGSGRDNLQHWFVDSGVVARAHEVGHAFGLKDEYADPLAANRTTVNATGVHQDHSLMGDFHQEGLSLAELKPRHAAEMVRTLSAHLGYKLKLAPASASGAPAGAETGSEAASAGAMALSIEALRELVQGFEARLPGEGRPSRLHP